MVLNKPLNWLLHPFFTAEQEIYLFHPGLENEGLEAFKIEVFWVKIAFAAIEFQRFCLGWNARLFEFFANFGGVFD